LYLNCHTYYSLRYGLLSPDELVEAALAAGASTLALTDINNTSCAAAFVSLCKSVGIKPVLGIEFREHNKLLYIGLAKNAEGFRELCEWQSARSMKGKVLTPVAPAFRNVWVIYPEGARPIDCLASYEFVGIRPEKVNELYFSNLRKCQDKLVILSPVTFSKDEHFRAHQVLRAIDLNIIASKLTEADVARKTECFLTPERLEQLFQAFPKIIRNTRQLLESCHIDFSYGLHHNRQHFTGTKDGDYSLLEKLALNGCIRRYAQDSDMQHPQALERLKKELKVIHRQDFCAYFLIAWDIVRYAHTAGYHHVGRGSGANSIVAYCIGITDVDPLELNLYFERFINPYRSSPPDFDIDFSWNERDDITDYIFKRYGEGYTALLATYNTFKMKAAIREVGKVFGLPKAEIDAILREKPGQVVQNDRIAEKVVYYARQIEGLPNYLSIHAGGVLISERPLYYFTALQQMPKGFPITHFDMYHAEDIGFHKFDILSQRGLGHIKDAVELIRSNRGRAVDVYDVEKIKQNEEVKALLRSGNCLGCFYIESPAMRGLLHKLGCDNYVHLVAASSIIRPGVAQSGMMRAYINRFHHPDSFTYLHPVFEEQLGETFGVMVYQEDVMKILHHFAGLDLDESDVLRRIMSGKKYKGDTFNQLRRKYFDNCRDKGYPEELAAEVWRQVESFSGYSFCKAHSASFAVESFQSLYLKAYFPLEFMVAVINNFGGFYHTEYYFHEARMQGGIIHPPCVNKSYYLTNIEGDDIFIGFVHLHQMEQAAARRIVHSRSKGGAFQNLEDFMQRVDITPDQLDILIRINAFRFTGKNKYELMWEKNALLGAKHRLEPSLFSVNNSTGDLFPSENFCMEEGLLEEGLYDQAFDEIELLGFPLCSPFNLLEIKACQPCVFARQLYLYNNRQVRIRGYYVCQKNLRTVKNQVMSFGTWLDEEGYYFDTTHFPDALARTPFRGKGIYEIEGKVVQDFGFPTIEVTKMTKLPFVKDQRY
jgi:DNA-directed DNA polymerase III PolC